MQIEKKMIFNFFFYYFRSSYIGFGAFWHHLIGPVFFYINLTMVFEIPKRRLWNHLQLYVKKSSRKCIEIYNFGQNICKKVVFSPNFDNLGPPQKKWICGHGIFFIYFLLDTCKLCPDQIWSNPISTLSIYLTFCNSYPKLL